MKTAIAMREDKMAIEYIDREKAKRLLHIEYAYAAEQLLDEIPAADVMPVVRCKDCKHSYDDISGLCCSHGVCVDCNVPEDFFCSYGERKNVDNAEG